MGEGARGSLSQGAVHNSRSDPMFVNIVDLNRHIVLRKSLRAPTQSNNMCNRIGSAYPVAQVWTSVNIRGIDRIDPPRARSSKQDSHRIILHVYPCRIQSGGDICITKVHLLARRS